MTRDPPAPKPAPKRPRKPPRDSSSSTAEAPPPLVAEPNPRLVRLLLEMERRRETSITGR